VLLFLRARGRGASPRRASLRAGAAGAALAVAFLFKYTAVFLLPGAAVLLAAATPRRAAAVLALVGGFLLPLAGLATWLAASGASGAYLEHVRWLAGYAGIRQAESAMDEVARFGAELLSGFPVLAACAAWGAAWTVVRVGRARARRDWTGFSGPAALWIWALASSLAVIVQGKYFRYHFLPVLPPLALLGAWSASDALAFVERRAGRISRVAVALGLVAAALLAPPYRSRLEDLFEVARGAVPRESYWSRPEFAMLGFSLRDDLLLARWVEQATRPKERVVLWGFEPLVHFVARRDPVGRFAYSIPLTREANLPELREEFLEALRADPPELFVIERGDVLPLAFGHWKDSHRTFAEWEELRAFVESRYAFLTALGTLDGIGRGDEPRFLVYRLQ
jgi:hypothetical protein